MNKMKAKNKHLINGEKHLLNYAITDNEIIGRK